MSPAGAQTRRSVLLGSAAVAGAAVITGCGSSRPHQRAAPVIPLESDVDLLNGALAVEQRSIALYEPAVPLFTGFAREVARLFLVQELQHAGELRKLITQAGADPHDPQTHYRFGKPRTTHHLMTLLHELELEQLAAYRSAIPRLSSPELRQSISSIMANDAQHIVVLRAELGVTAVPGPFLADSE